MVRAIMHGCNGAMGHMITNIIKEDTEIEIVAGVDLAGKPEYDYPVFKTFKECDVEADVIIDFAYFKAMDALLDYCEEKKVPAVLCTTALTPEQIERISKVSNEVALLRSANMSLGINTIEKLLKQAVSVFAPAGFDVEIVEKHHNLKKDAMELGISAVRGGNIVGEHEVFFCGLDEVIEIKHTAYSKAVFAKGAIAAAKYLAGKPAGLYDMKNVING